MDNKRTDPLDNAAPLWESDKGALEIVHSVNELVDSFGVMRVMLALQDSRLAGSMHSLIGTNDQLRVAIEMLSELAAARNAGLAIDLMSMALGIGERTGTTLTKIAARHGCTKQNASRMLYGFTKRLGIAKLPCQQSEETRDAYRQQNKRNYA